MANPVIINPTLTLAGQAAAFNASDDGLELKITHVSFGTAHYDPDGNEIALVAPVGLKVPVAGASRPTPYQIRMVSTWSADVGEVAIGEIAFWSDDTLVFVWSKADGTIASYKTDGVTYVLFNDLAFASVPANSISFVVDPLESVALAALAAHEGAYNAHPQYVLRAKFPDYQGHLWGDVTGTANAITLTLPAIVELTEYIKGNRFSFKATTTNTGDTTINVEGVGAVQVLKTGGVPLSPGSIVAGGVYDVYYDGAKFQLTAGAGFASAEVTDAEAIALTDTTSTSWLSLRRLIKALLSFARLDGATFTGDVKGLTPAQFDNDTSFSTTSFLRRRGEEASGFTSLSANTTLDATAVGGVTSFSSASPLTCTLPLTTDLPVGRALIRIACASPGGLTVAASVGNSVFTSNGITGSIVMSLGDTAEFICLTNQWRLVGGSILLKYSGLMAGPNWLTQPQFANDDSFATTKFVQRAVGSFSAGRAVGGAAVSLLVTDVGQLVTLSLGAAQTATLPLLADVPLGATITLHNPAAFDKTIVPAGSDKISPDGALYTSAILKWGDTVSLTKESGVWRMHGMGALKYSAQMAAALWTTQPQFANDDSFATTKFVQRALGSYSGYFALGVTTALTAAHVGTLILPTASGKSFTLPPLAGLPAGSKITFYGNQFGGSILPPSGVIAHNGVGRASITLGLYDTAEFTLTASSGWYCTGGSLALVGASVFEASLTGPTCTQRLPSGDIEQWGLYVGAASGANVVITLPVTLLAQATNVELTFVDTGNDIAVGQAPVLQVRGNTLGTLTVRNLHTISASFFWKVRGRV